MIVINLWGAPSSGKSTGASYLFSELKLKGYNVELVTEFAKDLTWEENYNALDNQFYVSGCQSYRLSRLKNKVDIVITDSPLPIGIMYLNSQAPKHLKETIMEDFNKYHNINFHIIRDKPYNPIGRNQTETESDKIAQNIKEFLRVNDIQAIAVKGNKQGYKYILNYIVEMIEGNNVKI